MQSNGKLEPIKKTTVKDADKVYISAPGLSVSFLDDLISYCGVNRPQTFVKSLSTIRGCLINRQYLKALDRIESLVPSDAFTCAVKLQLHAFFKKNDSIPLVDNIDEVTMAAFSSAEETCMRQNILESYYSCNVSEDPHNLNVMRIKNRIKSVLGPFSNFENRLTSLQRLSQGASSLHARTYSADFWKIFRCHEMSSECAVVARYVYQNDPIHLGRLGYGANKYNYSRIVTVPKNYKAKRTIAAEPTGHNLWQLAFDTFCKERLKDYGIDLYDQTANQQLAFEGSCTGRYATVDLKQASDTIAYEVVKLLLPEEWFDYLDFVRTPTGLLPDGTEVKFQKFSSMGNGTTFCIETLIFEAIAYVASRQSYDRLVYGDDIIVRTECVPDLFSMLKRFGFSINLDKTHIDGPYRESCGEHYWNGIRVTPINLLKGKYRVDDFYDFLNRMLENLVSDAYEGCTFTQTIEHLAKCSRDYDLRSRVHGSRLQILFVPPGSPSSSGIRSPAVCGNVRLWRMSQNNDGILEYKGAVVVPKMSTDKQLGRYLVWLARYSGVSQNSNEAPYLKRVNGVFEALEPQERVTSSSSDVLHGRTYVRAKMLTCNWQVLHNSGRSIFLDIDWNAFRSQKIKSKK